MVKSHVLAATLIASGLSYAASDASAVSDIKPSLDVAKSRGPQIFNAVQDSMRQWGASLHHNGMSFFLATVPEGVIFHHGNNNEKSPDDPDWLAYEIEHAEHFARGGRGPPGGGKGPGRGGPPGPSALGGMEYPTGQFPLVDDHASMDPMTQAPDEDAAEPEKGGWLHTYRTTRPLRYIYVDGMGGGKTSMGTLDSQDYLLRGTREVLDFDNHKKREVHEKRDSDKVHAKRAGGPMDEQARAVELCALCKDWNLSGIVRMEAGFEIIHCDFSDGLEEIQALQRPGDNEGPGGRGGFGNFEFVRGLSERYNDIGSSRTVIDYSSMVSAYFFPVNLTNPDPKRPDLPRLSGTTDAELAAIQKYLNETISDRLHDRVRPIDWQDVTDLIVGRYADRIRFMAEKTSTASQIASELNFLLTVYLDYSGKDSDQVSAAIERCTTFYLHGVHPVTESDQLIHAGIKETSSQLCTSLFQVRDIVSNVTEEDDSEKHSQAVSVLLSLMDQLQWARFKSCGGCAVDEVCLIPMWPSGTKADYDSPRCVNSTSRGDGENYWGGRGPGGGRGGRGGRGPPK